MFAAIVAEDSEFLLKHTLIIASQLGGASSDALAALCFEANVPLIVGLSQRLCCFNLLLVSLLHL